MYPKLAIGLLVTIKKTGLHTTFLSHLSVCIKRTTICKHPKSTLETNITLTSTITNLLLMKQFCTKNIGYLRQLALVCLCMSVALMSTSCQKEEPFEAAYFSLIDNASGNFAKKLSVSPDGGIRTLTVVSNRDWSIEYQKADWLTIEPLSGNGVGTITLTIAPNDGIGESSTTMNIINNTLKVVSDFVITRQDYLGEYKGTSTVASPITYIASTADDKGVLSTVASSVAISAEGNDLTMTFNATLKTGMATYFTIEMPVAVTKRIDTVDGKTKFVFEGSGTYDMTPLGTSLGDAAVTGVKNTYITATLGNDRLNAEVMFDPDANHSSVENRTTTFTLTASK